MINFIEHYVTEQDLVTYPVRIIVPDVTVRGFDWFSEPQDEQGYTVSIARTDVM
ncbi:MAG: hypothetical protein RR491_01245 [Lachnospiraceae bacterium]